MKEKIEKTSKKKNDPSQPHEAPLDPVKFEKHTGFARDLRFPSHGKRHSEGRAAGFRP